MKEKFKVKIEEKLLFEPVKIEVINFVQQDVVLSSPIELPPDQF